MSDWSKARAALEAARNIVVLTGAGVSAESGVPTFRDTDGLWHRFRPEELATPEAFRDDPRLVWEWYGWRRERVAACAPNAGHLSLARLALGPRGVTVVTQNVDDLHERADDEMQPGTGGAGPLHLHGSLFRSRCTACGVSYPDREPVDATDEDSLPRCPACGGLARPDVVWFGELLDEDLLRRAFRLARDADVCLVVGTSSVVYPAASVPRYTRAGGGFVIEVNPSRTPLSALADAVLQGPAGGMIPPLVADLWSP